MKQFTLYKLGFVILILAACIFKVKTQNIRKGLDLKGGAFLKYKYDVINDTDVEFSDEEKKSKVERALKTIRNRIDPTGAGGESVKTEGDQWISIQIPAVDHKDVNESQRLTTKRIKEVKSILTTPGQLAFHLVARDQEDSRAHFKLFPHKDGGKQYLLETPAFFKDGVVLSTAGIPQKAGIDGFVVNITFDAHAKELFYQLTKKMF